MNCFIKQHRRLKEAHYVNMSLSFVTASQLNLLNRTDTFYMTAQSRKSCGHDKDDPFKKQSNMGLLWSRHPEESDEGGGKVEGSGNV